MHARLDASVRAAVDLAILQMTPLERDISKCLVERQYNLTSFGWENVEDVARDSPSQAALIVGDARAIAKVAREHGVPQ
jgi:hypothetical protein